MIDPDELRRHIEAAYATCGNTQGWRFLYSPASVLKHADVAIIGYNPGGVEEVAGHGQFAMKDGESAYVHEMWKRRSGRFYDIGKAPLQIQIKAICDRLGERPEQALTGNVILWRSYAGKELRNPDLALQFGLKLWRDVLKTVQPSTIVAYGIETGNLLAPLLDMGLPTKIPVGWGDLGGKHATNGRQRLITLPHLSRFTIMNREASKPALDRLFSL